MARYEFRAHFRCCEDGIRDALHANHGVGSKKTHKTSPNASKRWPFRFSEMLRAAVPCAAFPQETWGRVRVQESPDGLELIVNERLGISSLFCFKTNFSWLLWC